MRYPLFVSIIALAAAGVLVWPAGARVGAFQAVAAPLAPYTETIPDTKVTFDMVPVPAGSFVMGSPESEPGRAADEGPQHTVKLPGFYIGKIEVTWDEYDQFGFSLDLQKKRKLGTALSKEGADAVSRPTPPYADESWGWGKEKQPVIGITHYSALKYCEWLSAKTGKKYRLPTEAEWEYAARAGTKTAYSFGDDAAQLGDTPGTGPTPASSRTSADRRSRTPGVCTTCTATSPSGPRMRTTRRSTGRRAPPLRRPSTTAVRPSTRTSYAAGRGTMTLRACAAQRDARRKRSGAAAIRKTRRASGGTPTRHSLASAWYAKPTDRHDPRPLSPVLELSWSIPL